MCIVLYRASKHEPHSHIIPYWSDRVSRKLAKNTNTAWGGSLKLETSLLSMVFSSSGNHLVAHAYQVLSPSLSLRSAFFRLCCFFFFSSVFFFCNVCVMVALKRNGKKHAHRKLKLQANLSNPCVLVISQRRSAFVASKKKIAGGTIFVSPYHLFGDVRVPHTISIGRL